MKNYSQKDLLDEGFWNSFKKPFKIAGGAFGAAVKGGARALDYVAPEITNPLHRFESGVRDIASQSRKGFSAGYGGLSAEYGNILLDAGYVMDERSKVIKSGKNHVVIGYRIVGKNPTTGKPIPDHKKISFLFDKDGRFSIINTSVQGTAHMSKSEIPKTSKVKKPKK